MKTYSSLKLQKNCDICGRRMQLKHRKGRTFFKCPECGIIQTAGA